MIYPFECEPCGVTSHVDARAFHPPEIAHCPECGEEMLRVFGCQIDTSGCKDHDSIPQAKRVRRYVAPRSAEAEEARFEEHIKERRAVARAGGNDGPMRQTHSVPADLYHGKIRETGDKEYWTDPKNLARHNSTRVDDQ